MNEETVELMCLLQEEMPSPATWARIADLLPTQRKQLARAARPAELADLCDLLQQWSEKTEPPLSSLALLDAAALSEQELRQPERAVEIYERCLERDRMEFDAWTRLETLLLERGEGERLQSILIVQADAMRDRGDIDPSITANAYQRLGQLRLDLGHVDDAIAAYEQALDLAVDTETLGELANAYRTRGSDDDLRQAADLYCTLGDSAADEDGRRLLERALNLVPDHDAALEALERSLPDDEAASRLRPRWEAYLAYSSNAAQLEAVREKLRSHAPASTLDADEAGEEPVDTALVDTTSYDAEASYDEVSGLEGAPVEDALASEPSAAAEFDDETSPGAPIPLGMSGFRKDDPNPKTLLGIGIPEQLVAVNRATNEDRRGEATSTARVPPLFSGSRQAAPEYGSDIESSADHPGFAEVPAQARSGMQSRAPLFAVSNSSEMHMDELDLEPLGDNPLDDIDAEPFGLASPPPYSLPPVESILGAAPSPSGTRRLLALLAWAALIGSSVGLAIGYGLRLKHGSANLPPVTAATQVEPTSGSELGQPPTSPEPAANAAPTPVPAVSPVAVPGGPSVAPAAQTAGSKLGEVTFGATPVKTRGGLSPAEVSGVLVGSGFAAIDKCYEDGLAQRATLHGTLAFTWSIDRAGKVARVKNLGGTLKDAAVEDCTAERVRGLQFPTGKARPTNVLVPLVFHVHAK